MYIRTALLSCITLAAPCLAAPSSTQVSTLSQAIAHTTNNNPRIKIHQSRIAASGGTIQQAKLRPNPELEVEIEEFGGSRDGFNETESTLALSQELELGGKRSARIAVASTSADMAKLEADIYMLEILSNTEIAFARVQKAQAIKRAVTEQVKLSRKVVQTAKKKLEAGAILQLEKTKAIIALQNDTVRLQEAEGELLNAKLALASLWNGTASDVGEVSTAKLAHNIDREPTANTLKSSPYLKLAEAKHRLATEELKLEKSLALPEVNVGFGYKRFEETNDNTFLGTFSLELPFFDRNQGSILSAQHELNAQELSKKNTALEIRTTLQTLQNSLTFLLSQYQTLNTEILPSAEQAFNEAQAAYRQGRSSYLELMDARETLFQSSLKQEQLLFQIVATKSQINKFAAVNITSGLE